MNRRTIGRLWVLGAACLAFSLARSTAAQEIWRFDQTASVGGHTTKVLGHPQVIDTAMGKGGRVQRRGRRAVRRGASAGRSCDVDLGDDLLKPDADGKPEQRVFHLQSVDPTTGADIPNERMLFEIRVRSGADGKPGWCLDSFATAGGQSRALLNCEKMHPFGQWYRVTAVYDGKMLHNYVGDELQGEGPLVIPAERPGRASLGTRIDKRDYYKGTVYEARFTRKALAVDDFLKIPAAR